MSVLGIDPGQNGGIALRSRDTILAEVMPTKDGALDIVELTAWLKTYREEIEIAYIEEPGMRLKQRLQDCAKQHTFYGQLLGILGALGINTRIVRGQEWSKMFPHGIQEKEKHARYRAIKTARKGIVARMFPGIDLRESSRCKTAHEGMTDALLIAEYGYRSRSRG